MAGLYSGMGSSLIGVASTNFAYFYWYSVVRALYLSPRLQSSVLWSGSPSAVAELGLGAVAGALAQLFTIPVAVVTTRQQTQRKGERKGLFETAREVLDGEDGWTGLWRGLKASLVLVVNPAITYGAYERLRKLLFPGKATLKPREAFSKFPCAVAVGGRCMCVCIDERSSRCIVQSPRNDRHAAVDRGQGGITITSTARKTRQAVQELCRGDALYRQE